MRLAALLTLAFLLLPAAAEATDRPTRRPWTRVTGFVKPEPIKTMDLGTGQNTVITLGKLKITRAVTGDPTIVEIMPFQKAVPTIGLRARRPGVTNVLIWTTDAQVHTYRVLVR